MSSPGRRTQQPQEGRALENRTIAYFLKDRAEGVPMPNKALASAGSPKESPDKRPKYNTRSKSSTEPSASNKKSVTRIVAPQLKIVDGKVVLDDSYEHPSTREELTTGMTVVQEDPNRYFTSATYSKRSTGGNRWNPKETDLFYEALSMCGTDFSMIATLFPHRTRNQIKGKYKIEEKSAAHRVSAALATRRTFDAADFANRLARAVGSSAVDNSKR